MKQIRPPGAIQYLRCLNLGAGSLCAAIFDWLMFAHGARERLRNPTHLHLQNCFLAADWSKLWRCLPTLIKKLLIGQYSIYKSTAGFIFTQKRDCFEMSEKNIDSLPDEILEQICGKLDFRSKFNVAQTNFRLRKIANRFARIGPVQEMLAENEKITPLAIQQISQRATNLKSKFKQKDIELSVTESQPFFAVKENFMVLG